MRSECRGYTFNISLFCVLLAAIISLAGCTNPEKAKAEHIKKGDAFAFQNGAPLTVAEDTYLLIPMTPEKTKVHEEVCYLGRKLAR